MMSGSKVGSGTVTNNGKRNDRYARRRRIASAAMFAVGSGILARHAYASNDLWVGNTSVNFGTGANWTSTAVPVNQDSLEFNAAGSSGLTLSDNLMTPAAFNLSALTFDSTAPAYIIGPGISGTNGFTLSGTITNNSTALETINDLVALNGSCSVVTTGNMTFGGVISGTGSLSTSGGGTISLSALNSFTGNLSIGSGTVVDNVSNNSLTNSVSTPNTSGIGAVDTARTITIGSGGTLNFNAANGLGTNSNTLIQANIVVNAGGTLKSSVAYTTLGAITLNGGTLTNTVAAGSYAWYMRGNLNTCILTVGGSSPSIISGTGYFGVSSTPMTFNVGVTGSSGADLTVSDTLANSPTGAASGIRKTGLGTMLVSGTTLYTGSTQVSQGTLQFNGSTGASLPTSLYVGLTASTPAIFSVLPGAVATYNGAAYIGDTSTSAGAVYQSGGTVTGISTMSIGAVTGGAYGYYNLSAGSNTLTELDAGGINGASVGVVDVTGGTLKTTGYLCVSRGTGIGIVNVLGGNVNVASGQFDMGFGAASTSIVNVGGTGNVVSPTVSLNMTYTPASGELGELNLLSGGTAQVAGITSNTSNGASTFINFNGGTLKAGGANASFLTGTSGTAVTGVEVYSGGGTINNNNSNITISSAIVPPTGSGVTFGTITPSAAGSGYVGAPAVTFTGGGGVGATGYAVMSGGTITGVVVTNPGINYTSAPTVVFTGGGGTGAAATSAITANVGGGMNFSGGGITTLSGASTYTGPTNILSGSTLNVTGSLGNTTVTVNSGGYLTGSGSIAGTINVSSGGLVDFTRDGLSTTTTLTAGGMTLGAASSPAGITFNVAASSADSINLGSGVLNDLGGAVINLNALNISSGTATYTLISYGSQTGLTPTSGGGFTIGSRPAGLYTFMLNDTSTALQLTVSSTAPPLTAYWTGKDDTVWGDYNSSGPVTNFSSTSDGNTDTGQIPSSATDVVFTAGSNGNGTSLTGAAISTTLGSNFTINSLTVNSTAGSVAINGSNTLTLNAAASTGSLGYSAGTGLIVQSGAGAVNIGVTTLIPATSQSWSNNGANPLTISSVVTGPASSVGTTTLTFSGSGSGSTTLSGAIGNGSASGKLALVVAQTGGGPVILSGNNTFTGGVLITSGTLSLGNSGALNSTTPNSVNLSGGTLDLNTNSITLPNLIGGSASAAGGVITDNNASTGTTTLTDSYQGTALQTFYGSMNDGATRKVGLVVTGFYNATTPTFSTLALAGSSTYSGGTQLVNGVLEALSSNALGTGTVNMSGGTAVSLKIANGVNLANKIIVNAASPGAGLGALTTVTSSDTATFSGEIDYNVAVVSGGLIAGPGSSGMLSFTGPIIEPTVNPPPFIQLRSGYVQMADATGNSSYPELLVATGSASLGHNNGIATNAALVMNNGTIDLNGYNQTVSAIGLYPGATSGIITNTNANLGGNSGAASGPNTSSVLTVNTSATAYPDSAPDIYAGNLNTHIQLVKTGAGTLSLTGTTNTYLGGTVIQQGVLAVSTLDNGSVQSPNSLGESYLGPSDLTFAAPGGTLRYAGTGATASTSRGFTISDNATATIDVSNATTVLTVNGSAAVDGTESTNPASFAKGPGVGTVILTGTYPYHGNTTVNGGTLVVNGTTGTAGYGSISIASGATLGGTGTLSGAFNHTAGTIVGGASLTLPTTGSLTFTDPVTLNGGTDLNNINSSALSTSGVNQQGYINASGGLTFGSIPETVSLQFVGTLPAGNYMYNLFDYSGTPVVTPNIVYTSNLGRATFTTDLTTTGQVNVNVSSGVASLFWNSTSSGTWDVALNASSGTANWYNTGTNAADKYYQGDSVTFADSGTTVGTGTLGTPLQTNITINTTVAPGSIAVTSNTSNYSFSGTGNISGSGTLTKSGSSTLTIATANTYTGNTTISGGTVILSNTTGSGLGTGSVTVGTGVTLSFLYAPSASLGNSSMVNNGTVNYNASGAGTLPVPMSGTGVFTVTGTGNVILSGANTYSGGTYVNAGLIYTAGNSSAFGGSSGGAVNINPGGEIYFNSAGGSYPNAFNLNQSGSSQTVLEAGGGGVSTISGPVNLTTASTLYVDGGVTLIFANTNALTSTNAGLTVGGGGGSSFGIGGNVSIGTGQLAVTAGSLQFTPPASTTITVPCVITGTAAVTQTGPGETVLSGSNTYTGGVNVNGGILQITNSAALGAATNQISIAGGVTTTAQLQLSGGSITVSGPILLGGRAGASANLAHIDSVSGNNFITGNISTTTGGNIYTLESDSGLLTVSGAWNASAGTGLRYYDLQGAGNGLFSGNISNGTAQVALTMQGTGTWTLSGSNAYTGGTNVASGTLVLKSAAAFPSATNLTVASGATLQISNHSTGSSASLVVVGQPTNGGTIDITNNAIDIQTITTGVSDISTINAEAAAAYNGGHWNGTSGTMGVITSTTAANDPMHLTAVGVATGLTSFELGTVASTDVLVKYTYYGDALLTGSVTSADYAKIDLGFLTNLTGWQNGDFNYDNVINGSDYTLIDNAFNMQGVNLATEIASPTAQIAGAGSSSVPEPASLMLIGMGALGLLGRRSCRRH